jgi:hypothetical protein
MNKTIGETKRRNAKASVEITAGKKLSKLEKAVLVALFNDILKPNKEYDRGSENEDDEEFLSQEEYYAFIKRTATYRFKLDKLNKRIMKKKAFKDIAREELEAAVTNVCGFAARFKIYDPNSPSKSCRSRNKDKSLLDTGLSIFSSMAIDKDKDRVYLSFAERNIAALKKQFGSKKLGKALAKLEFKDGWK